MSRFPFPCLPTGWYAVALSDELRPREVRRLRYFERELALYRTEGGTPLLVDAHCPHMGAHLAHGGKVQGELLRCPFHGFCFDTEGACASTPYGTLPSDRARLRPWSLRERNGLLLAWYDGAGRAPDWEVPALETAGWTKLSRKRYEIPSHPQETTENSVDFGHFTEVHDFRAAEMATDVETDGPLLQASYSVKQPLKWIGMPFLSATVHFDVRVWGLGYSLVEAHVQGFDIRIRDFVLPVPLDGENLHLRLASSIRSFRGGAVTAPLAAGLRAMTFRTLCHEVEADIPLWSHKAYVDPPALARGDGPVGRYRRWARQFYSS